MDRTMTNWTVSTVWHCAAQVPVTAAAALHKPTPWHAHPAAGFWLTCLKDRILYPLSNSFTRCSSPVMLTYSASAHRLSGSAAAAPALLRWLPQLSADCCCCHCGCCCCCCSSKLLPAVLCCTAGPSLCSSQGLCRCSSSAACVAEVVISRPQLLACVVVSAHTCCCCGLLSRQQPQALVPWDLAAPALLQLLLGLIQVPAVCMQQQDLDLL